jgi:aryl-alcohol dehydrogenase-like predicted oxidoreductase
MFVRDKMESEYRTLFETRQMGTTIWSPLYGGALCGKYNDGTLPEGSRGQEAMSGGLGLIKPRWFKYFGLENVEKTKIMLQGIAELAKELGCTQAQLALAWTIVMKDTSTCINGFSRVEQIDENFKCLEVMQKWSPEIEARIDKILGNAPEATINYRAGAPLASRRQ